VVWEELLASRSRARTHARFCRRPQSGRRRTAPGPRRAAPAPTPPPGGRGPPRPLLAAAHLADAEVSGQEAVEQLLQLAALPHGLDTQLRVGAGKRRVHGVSGAGGARRRGGGWIVARGPLLAIAACCTRAAFAAATSSILGVRGRAGGGRCGAWALAPRRGCQAAPCARTSASARARPSAPRRTRSAARPAAHRECCTGGRDEKRAGVLEERGVGPLQAARGGSRGRAARGRDRAAATRHIEALNAIIPLRRPCPQLALVAAGCAGEPLRARRCGTRAVWYATLGLLAARGTD
jgi:hypothetical protein